VTINTYLQCDICNTKFDGLRKEAIEWGWIAKRDGSGWERHICLECREKGCTELNHEPGKVAP
jgi:hypothetical protein